jgi:hypothetical protein
VFDLLSFSHTKSDTTFVKGLIGLDCHSNFISYSHKKETSFGTVNGDLSN